MDIGNRIQEIRKASNMTGKELAEKIDISPSFISAIENNTSKLSLSTLRKICDALEVTLSEFFYEKTEVVDAKLLSVIKSMPEEKKWQLFNFLDGLFSSSEE